MRRRSRLLDRSVALDRNSLAPASWRTCSFILGRNAARPRHRLLRASRSTSWRQDRRHWSSSFETRSRVRLSVAIPCNGRGVSPWCHPCLAPHSHRRPPECATKLLGARVQHLSRAGTQASHASQNRGEPQCRLTLRSSGPPPAWHLARAPASVIIRRAGQAPIRRCPLSSNVRPRSHLPRAHQQQQNSRHGNPIS